MIILKKNLAKYDLGIGMILCLTVAFMLSPVCTSPVSAVDAFASELLYLGTPSNLTATVRSASQVDLSWTDNANGESSYRIERKTGDGNFTVIATKAANSVNYSDSKLNEGTTYTYRVKAVNDPLITPLQYDSDYSNEASAATWTENNAGAIAQTVMQFYIGLSQYYVNDREESMDAAPEIINERTMLPITYVATPLGIKVQWSEEERKVILTRQDTVIELWINQSIARVNGSEISIDINDSNVRPRIIGGRTMLPISFIGQQLNCQVDWIASKREVNISYPAS